MSKVPFVTLVLSMRDPWRCRLFPLLLVCALASGCASQPKTTPTPAHELSSEQLVTIINAFFGLTHRDLVSFVKEFYRTNQRWPADTAELKSFVGTRFRVVGRNFDIIMPYKSLEIVENDVGDCLVTYTSKDNTYEAKITILRPRN